MSEKKQASLVKVKVLAYVGRYTPGSIVEVSEEESTHLTAVKHKNDGHGVISYQNAMKLEDYEQMVHNNKNKKKDALTQGELAEMGLKDANVVETPKDPAFEAHLKAIAKRNEEKNKSKKGEVARAKAKVDQKKKALEDGATSKTA